jgi:hypothetical protein
LGERKLELTGQVQLLVAHTDEKNARILAYASGCYLLAPIKKKPNPGLDRISVLQ